MRRAVWALALAALLQGQDTPRPNRVVWFGIFPEPLPDGRSSLTLEGSSQFLRPDWERTADGRTFARLDGEEWQLTGDLGLALGPGRLCLRLRAVHRSGGWADQLFASWHTAFGMPQGGREMVPTFRLAYHLERDGVVVADLQRPGLHLLDTDVAYVVSGGDAETGWRSGLSLQLPTGKREDFSGSGGTDVLTGAAAWHRIGAFTFHTQAEHVRLGIPVDNPYRRVLARRFFTRAWAGAGWQGQGSGLFSGLGLDLSLAWMESPYRVGIPRVDGPGWSQHWTFSHRALPGWHMGLSEEAGTYVNPDLTLWVGRRF